VTSLLRLALRAGLTSGLALGLAGCFEAGYVAQAAQGQLGIACNTRDLDKAARDDGIEAWKRALLAEVPDIKRFAVASGLVPTPSYEAYVELPRPVAVYVVSASHPLRFEGLTWSFPIVGSVPYLGYFERDSAYELGDELREAGWDVDVRGARAYSTLGWFDDPVLSSMLEEGPAGPGELANTVLHESLHATVYIPSQSSFNESVASYVGDVLAERWLTQRFGPESPELHTYRQDLVGGEERTERLHRAYAELDALYKSKLPPGTIRVRKARLLHELHEELGMARMPNNATLIGFRTYESGDAELEALHVACGRDMRRFVKAVATADAKLFDEPQQEDVAKVLAKLVKRGCPT
jgi:predicted aminopeptidase